jgi:hypothetical protein
MLHNHMKIVIAAVTLPKHQGTQSECRRDGNRTVYKKLSEESARGNFKRELR